MTTYPLSEPARIYADDGSEVLGQGTLAECVDIIQGLPDEARSLAEIKMDNLALSYGPAEVGELLQFLRNEDAGLSNKDIADIAGSIE